MFRRWFEHPHFNDDDRMAGRRRGPHPRPDAPAGDESRGRGRGRGRGGPGFGPGGPGFGFGGPGGPGFGFGGPRWGAMLGEMFGRGQRARRGNVRSAILSLLAEQPHNGYQIMQAIEQRSHGQWRPSSGSIYPTLQQLEDEELVETEERAGQSGSKIYKLSAKGRRYVDDNREELDAEWAALEEDPSTEPRWQIMKLFRELGSAAMQVAQNGSAKQVEDAKQLLVEVRRNLYRILAELPDDEG